MNLLLKNFVKSICLGTAVFFSLSAYAGGSGAGYIGYSKVSGNFEFSQPELGYKWKAENISGYQIDADVVNTVGFSYRSTEDKLQGYKGTMWALRYSGAGNLIGLNSDSNGLDSSFNKFAGTDLSGFDLLFVSDKSDMVSIKTEILMAAAELRGAINFSNFLIGGNLKAGAGKMYVSSLGAPNEDGEIIMLGYGVRLGYLFEVLPLEINYSYEADATDATGFVSIYDIGQSKAHHFIGAKYLF